MEVFHGLDTIVAQFGFLATPFLPSLAAVTASQVYMAFAAVSHFRIIQSGGVECREIIGEYALQ